MKGIQWHPNRDINVSSESVKKWILFTVDIIQEVDILTQDCWEWHFMVLNVLIVSFIIIFFAKPACHGLAVSFRIIHRLLLSSNSKKGHLSQSQTSVWDKMSSV